LLSDKGGLSLPSRTLPTSTLCSRERRGEEVLIGLALAAGANLESEGGGYSLLTQCRPI